MGLFILKLTEGFPGVQGFQCPNQESYRKTMMGWFVWSRQWSQE